MRYLFSILACSLLLGCLGNTTTTVSDAVDTAASPSPTPDDSDAEAESTTTRTTCISENVLSGIATPIDIKLVINAEDGERTSLACYVLNNATKSVLAMKETTSGTTSDCSVSYDIDDGHSDYAWWLFTNGASSDYAVYDNTSGDFDNATVVFDDADCTTETVD